MTSSNTSNIVTLAFASVAHAFSHMFVLFFATVVLVLDIEWGMSYAELMALSVPGAVLFGVCALPAGWLGDKWSSSAMLAVFFIGTGLASVFTGLVNGPIMLAIGLSLIGVFASIYHPVGIPWLIKHTRNHARALGINGVFGSGGTAAAAIVAGFLASAFGWRAAFIAPGVLSVLIGLIFIMGMKQGWVVERDDELAPAAEQKAKDRRRVFGILALTVLCAGLIFQSLAYALPKIFEERLTLDAGKSVLGIGGLVSLCYGFSAVTQLLGGEMAQRYSKKWVYALGMGAQVPVALVAYFLFGPALVMASAMFVSLNVIGQPAENALLARFTPLSLRGRVYGIKFVLTLGVSALGVGMIPVIHATLGSLDALFVLLAAVALTGFAAAVFIPTGQD